MAQGSALTRNANIPHGSKNWLQRAILYRHKRYSVSGKIAGNIKVKLYMGLRWLFGDISGLMYSFDLSSFVNVDMVILLQWIAAGSSRKSIWERLGEAKVRPLDGNLTDFMLRGR